MRRPVLAALIALSPGISAAQTETQTPDAKVLGMGVDASATMTKATHARVARSQAAIAADRFNVMNFGARADATRNTTIGTAASNATTLQVAAPTRASVGQVVGIPAVANKATYGALRYGTKITDVSVSGRVATLRLSSPIGRAMPSGSTFDAGTDDEPAFTAASMAASKAGGGTVWVPTGAYFLSGVAQAFDNTAYLFDPGSQLYGNGSVAGNFAGVSRGSALTIMKSSTAQRGEGGIVVNLNLLPPSSVAEEGGYEKPAYMAWVETLDPSTKDGKTWYAGGHDAVGYEGIVNARTGNMFARLFGAHLRTYYRRGTDGNSWDLELETQADKPGQGQAGPTYTPQENSFEHKGGIHIDNAGTQDITSGIEIDGGGGAGAFHAMYEAMARGIRADGFGFVLFKDPNDDLTDTRNVLFGTDKAGNLAAAGSAYVSGILHGALEYRIPAGGNYTIKPGTDCGATIQMSGGGVVVVPRGLPDSYTASGRLANGLSNNVAGGSTTTTASCHIHVIQGPAAAGTVSIVGMSGETLTSTAGLTLSGPGAEADIWSLGANDAVVTGDLSAPNFATMKISRWLAQPAAEGVAAGGVNLATATHLESRFNTVTACSSGAVALPDDAPVGAVLTVFDRCGTRLKVYPSGSGARIEETEKGLPIALPANASTDFVRTSATQWRQKS